ncbi:MAG: GIY-YIG nuclease family protein [Euryarchaeota archaeon]|nr:GIY-YIG nuclease family protein [Euryarchaeota archaeon]
MLQDAGTVVLNAEFEKIINKFPEMMRTLVSSPPISKGSFHNVPSKGIYVFYDEDNKPIYVGRSDRMRSRLREHSQRSSTHTSATFAFNMAKDIAKDAGLDIFMPRKDLEKIPAFKKIYDENKERVSRMKIRTIEISDPIEQTLFEVYAHLELNTKNEFKNH